MAFVLYCLLNSISCTKQIIAGSPILKDAEKSLSNVTQNANSAYFFGTNFCFSLALCFIAVAVHRRRRRRSRREQQQQKKNELTKDNEWKSFRI